MGELALLVFLKDEFSISYAIPINHYIL